MENLEKKQTQNIGPELIKALADFQSKVPAITYNKSADFPTKNSRVQYSYATFDHMLNTIRKSMQECGLAFSQIVNADASVTTYLMHASGQYMHGTAMIKPQSDHPQTIGAAISYTKRYGLSAILGISSEEDDENVASSPARSSAQYRKTAAAAKSTPPPASSSPWENETPKELNVAEQIKNCKSTAELNKLYAEIKNKTDVSAYIDLFTKRKSEL